MRGYFVSYKQFAAALIAGFALRLFLVIRFPFQAGDTRFYEALARNWLDRGVYGLFVAGRLVPADMRMPGYPAFLAAVHSLFGAGTMPVALVQIFIDLAACVCAALIAAKLAPNASRRKVATIALWAAALCPFTANYTGVVLTETLAIFFTTLVILLFVWLLAQPSMDLPQALFERRSLLSFAGWFLLAGCLVGIGTLLRPETPLLLAAAALVLALRWRHRTDWLKLVLAGLCMALGLTAVLLPWAVRNAETLGRIEFLSPRYAQSAGDFIPRGFYAWTGTWMTEFSQAYLITWKLGKAPIPMGAFPNRAFDSAAERARVSLLLDDYDHDLQMSPALDRQFALLARERTRRDPLRTYLVIPAARAWAMWFTPRIELLPLSGKLWPPAREWHNDWVDFSVTLGLGALALAYVGLALFGARRCRKHPGFAMIAVYFITRTLVLTQMQTVEPRYVLECFPSLLAVAALCWCSSLGDAGCGGGAVAVRAVHRELRGKLRGGADGDEVTYSDHRSSSY